MQDLEFVAFRAAVLVDRHRGKASSVSCSAATSSAVGSSGSRRTATEPGALGRCASAAVCARGLRSGASPLDEFALGVAPAAAVRPSRSFVATLRLGACPGHEGT